MDFHPPLKQSVLQFRHTAKEGSIADSIESEDPLVGSPPPRDETPSQLQKRPNFATSASSPAGAAQGASSFAVVLHSSPRYRAYQELNALGSESDNAVTSDPKKKLKRPAPSTTTYTPNAHSTNAATRASRGRGRLRGSRMVTVGRNAVTAAASRQARQVKTVPSMNGYAKRRGRPPKQQSPPPREIYRRVHVPFVAYLCEWKGCKAELHNMDTLRRHVYIVHGREVPRKCHWAKCAAKTDNPTLSNESDFEQHMEEAHLVPFSWHIGDGPRNEIHQQGVDQEEEEGIPSFLMDQNGVQVTPSVKDQQVEDFVTWRNNRRKLKDLLIRRNENLPDESDEEEEGVGESNVAG